MTFQIISWHVFLFHKKQKFSGDEISHGEQNKRGDKDLTEPDKGFCSLLGS
jgi:hypothetical protein